MINSNELLRRQIKETENEIEAVRKSLSKPLLTQMLYSFEFWISFIVSTVLFYTGINLWQIALKFFEK